MKPILFALLFLPLVAFGADGVSVSHENPPAQPTEAKPEYLFFKKGTFTRTGKNKIDVEIDLAGKLPNNLSDKYISFSIGFDIDNNAASGSESIAFPGLGVDISAWVFKPIGTNKYDSSSGSVVVKSRARDIRISKLKVNDDKISFEMSSELFGEYPSLRLYVISSVSESDQGLRTSKTSVDQLPRGGALTLNSK